MTNHDDSARPATPVPVVYHPQVPASGQDGTASRQDDGGAWQDHRPPRDGRWQDGPRPAGQLQQDTRWRQGFADGRSQYGQQNPVVARTMTEYHAAAWGVPPTAGPYGFAAAPATGRSRPRWFWLLVLIAAGVVALGGGGAVGFAIGHSIAIGSSQVQTAPGGGTGGFPGGGTGGFPGGGTGGTGTGTGGTGTGTGGTGTNGTSTGSNS